MKKKSLLFLAILLSLLLNASSTFAQTASDESETDNDKNEVIQEGQERLKKAVKGISSDQEKRAFVGTVKRVSEEALTVETRKGTQIITLADVSVVQDNKAFTVSNIEIDSQVVVMGYQKGEDFTPKRILVLKKPLQTVKKTIWVGSVKKIDKLSITLTTRAGEEKVLSLPSKPAPIIEDNTGTTIKIADIEVDQDMLILTVPEDSGSQSVKDSAGKIVRIHSLAVADVTSESKEKPTATPKVTTKPSATPKAAAATKKPTATPKEE